MKFVFFFLSVLPLTCSKSNNEYNSSWYAQKYCNCFTENLSKGALLANKICDSILINENRFYRTWVLNMEVDTFFKVYPKDFQDSVDKFINNFSKYLEENCKESIIINPDSSNDKKMWERHHQNPH